MRTRATKQASQPRTATIGGTCASRCGLVIDGQQECAWRDVDPEAARVERRIAEEVSSRHGVDVRAGGSVDAQLAAAERADEQAQDAEQRQQQAETPEEATEAARDVEYHQVERDGAAAGAEVPWDSAERREATARELETRIGDPQAVDARMRSDVSQAKPATQATQEKRVRGTKTSPNGHRTARQQQRPELSR